MLIAKDQKRASVAMLLAFVSYTILFPLNIFLERDGWIWSYPGRNTAMEHMLVANYVVLGLFFLWGARQPVKYLPLIDLTIVTNIAHATVMLMDALRYPNHENHIHLGGDVPGTYLVPIILILGHPKYFYLPWFTQEQNVASNS